MKKLILTTVFFITLALPVMAEKPTLNSIETPSINANSQENTALVQAEKAFTKNKNSVKTRTNYARQLLRAGKYQEALTHYLWCYDQGAQFEPGYQSVRLNFLLAHISDFGKNYMPAIDALVERRDKEEKKLISNQDNDSATLRGIVLMNAKLENKVEKNIALFDILRSSGRQELTSTMAKLILDDLLEAKRYKDIVENADAIFQGFHFHTLPPFQSIALPENETKDPQKVLLEEKWKSTLLAINELSNSRQVEHAAKYFTALLGTSDINQARNFAQKIVDFAPTSKTFSLLIAKANDFGAKELASELVEQSNKIKAEETKAN